MGVSSSRVLGTIMRFKLSPTFISCHQSIFTDTASYFRIVSLLGVLEALTMQQSVYLKDLSLQEAKRDREDHKREL